VQVLRQWAEDFHAGVRYLLTTKTWDCLIAVYRTTDIVQHFLWRQPSPFTQENHTGAVPPGIAAVYRQVDSYLGELLTLLPSDTTVLLVSDHGGGPVLGRFYVNNWLQEHGYLVLKPGARYRRYLGYRVLPLHRVLTRLGGDRLVRRLPQWVMDRLVPIPDHSQFFQLIDWRRTRAYMPVSGVQSAGIRVNLRGREPQGIVLPGPEASALLAELVQRLTTLTDPQGCAVFQLVQRYHDTLHPVHPGPDLVGVAHEGHFYAATSQLTLDGRLFGKPVAEERGHHRLDGVCLMRGEAIAPGAILDQARLLDIAPTLLYLAGVAVPTTMEGRVLTEAIRPEWLAMQPVQTTSVASPALVSPSVVSAAKRNDVRVEEALRDLGYLE
jgi:predicted AlkP superfamily phosphohydrolase/phosphomutase